MKKIFLIIISLFLIFIITSCSSHIIHNNIRVYEGSTNNSYYKIWVPEKLEGDYNLIIAFHGDSSGNSSWTSSSYENRVLIRKKLLENDYIFAVCESKYDLSSWGNDKSSEAYFELFNFVTDNFNIKNVNFFCDSMGAIECLNFVYRKNIDFNCFCSTSMAYNLIQIYNEGKYSTKISNAYNSSDIDELKQNDPSEYYFRDRFYDSNFLLLYSPEDICINQEYNCFLFYERIKDKSNSKLIKVEGGHAFKVNESCLNEILNFYNTNN